MKPGKGNRFICDSECCHFKSIGICSHTVAVAELNGKLLEFVAFYKKTKRVPNLTSMATSGMPKGKGRKGSEPPRKRKRKETVESRVSLQIPEPSSNFQVASPLGSLQCSHDITISPQINITSSSFCTSATVTNNPSTQDYVATLAKCTTEASVISPTGTIPIVFHNWKHICLLRMWSAVSETSHFTI